MGSGRLVFVLLRPGSKTAPSVREHVVVAPIGAHLPSICCDPAGILPTLLVSRSSVFSWGSTRLFNAVTNQSIRRPTLAVGHQKTTHQQQLSVMLFSCTCWKGPGSVMCRIRVLPARSKAWVGRSEGLSCLMVLCC